MPLDTTRAPSSPSPLWIIALFIALSEVVAGTASVATDGSVRLVFAIFAVTFPVVVLAIFLWILLRYPGHLYSPGQYTEPTSVEAYVRALHVQRRDTQIAVSRAIEVASEEFAAAGADPAQTELATRAFEQAVRRAVVTIDPTGIVPAGRPVEVAVSDATTVGDLLDSIYFELSPYVRPFSYGDEWLLRDADGRVLDAIGTRWAQSQGRSRDYRPLAAVGIAAGAQLAVTRAADG